MQKKDDIFENYFSDLSPEQQKQAQEFLSWTQKLQENFYPDPDFKASLKQRIENIAALHQDVQEPTKLSWKMLSSLTFGAMACVLGIFWMTDIRNPDLPLMQQEASFSENNSASGFISDSQWEQIISWMEKENKEEAREEISIVSNDETWNKTVDTTPSAPQKSAWTPISASKNAPVPASSTSSQEIQTLDQNTETWEMSISERNDSLNVSDDSESFLVPDEMSSNIYADNSVESSADMMPASMLKSTFSSEMDTNFMYEDENYAEDSQAIYTYQQEEFYKICSENQGKVLEDNYSCQLPSGEVCTVDNISSYSAIPCEALYSKEAQ